jgi:flagellar biosynthesis/type III secretory pathway protein FliH
MKKLLTLISAACFTLIISCGPSAEEQQRIEQARLDSIEQAAQQALQDSINMAMEQARQDSMAMAAAMQDSVNKAMQDSLAALSSQVKNMGKPAKPKALPKQDDKPKEAKPGQGRG